MRVPGRQGSWAAVVILVIAAGGVAAASAISAPTSNSAAGIPTPTTISPSVPDTTIPPPKIPATTPTTVPGPTEGIQRVVFFDRSHGYGLFLEQYPTSCGLAVASTSDGGSTFATRVPVTPGVGGSCSSEGTSLAFDSAGDGFVYGPNLDVTHDGGRTWSAPQGFENVAAVVPLGRSVWMVEEVCPNSAPNSMCNLKLDRSADGGRTWVGQMLSGAQAPLDLSGGIQSHTWLVRTSLSSALVVVPLDPAIPTGTDSVDIFSTVDGGATWNPSTAPCIGGFGSVLSEAPGGTLWLSCSGQPGAGEQVKTVVRSVDGGKTWIQGPCPIPATTSTSWPQCLVSNGMASGYLQDVAATSSSTGFIDGGRSFVQVTHDGGKTWAVATPYVGDGDNTVGGLVFTNSLDGWVITSDGTLNGSLWRTTNGGSYWSQVWAATLPNAVAVCHSADLKAAEAVSSPRGSSGGELWIGFDVMNNGTTSCALPSLLADITLTSASGDRLPAVFTGSASEGTPFGQVVVSPGKTARDVVVWGNWCGAAPGPLTLTVTFPDGSSLQVPPGVAGSVGTTLNGELEVASCEDQSSPSTLRSYDPAQYPGA